MVTVTPQGSGGPCAINVSDGHGGNLQESVTVGPFGAVSPSPQSISLVVGGGSMGFSVNQANYTGPFTADASDCGSSASVSGGPTSFTVSPGTQAGNCSITVSDDHSQSAGVKVFVTSGGMSVTTNQLQFSGPTDSPQSFFATTSAPFATTITVISPPNPLVATVSPASGPAPTVQFTVTPVGNGRTSLTVDDGMGGQAVVSIGVGTTPLLVRNHHQRPRVNPALPGPRAPKKPWPSSPPIGGSTNKPSVYQPPLAR